MSRTSRWETATLERVTTSVRDGTHTPPKRTAEGVPLLSARNVTTGGIDFGQEYSFISESDFEAITRTNWIAEGDVLLTIVGSIGDACVVPAMEPFTVQRSVAIVRPDTEVMLSAFLRYWFLSPQFNRLLWETAAGTAQKGVYLKSLRGMPVPLPSLRQQAEVVSRIEELFVDADAAVRSLEDAARLAGYELRPTQTNGEGGLKALILSEAFSVSTEDGEE